MIYPVYIVLFLITIFIIRISKMINEKNKFLLKHLRLHYLLITAICVCASFNFLIGFKPPAFLITSIYYMAHLSFYFFLRKYELKENFKINKLFFLPLVVLFTTQFLGLSNFTDFSFNIENLSEENVVGFVPVSFLGNELILFQSYIFSLSLLSLIIYQFYTIYNNPAFFHDKSDFLKLGVIYFIPSMLSSLTSHTSLVLMFLNLEINSLATAARVFSIFALIVVTINPQIIRSISILKNKSPLEHNLKEYFDLIDSYLRNEKVFLNNEYSLVNISADMQISQSIIRKSIKIKTNQTVPSYLNFLRIEYACELMRANFLDKFSINALAKNSGFKSEKNFYRVFKKFKTVTPAKYYDEIKNI